jgi:hypothetical protein
VFQSIYNGKTPSLWLANSPPGQGEEKKTERGYNQRKRERNNKIIREGEIE